LILDGKWKEQTHLESLGGKIGLCWLVVSLERTEAFESRGREKKIGESSESNVHLMDSSSFYGIIQYSSFYGMAKDVCCC